MRGLILIIINNKIKNRKCLTVLKNMIMNYLLFQCNQPLQGCCTILGSWTVVFCIFFFPHADKMAVPTTILELLDYKEPNGSRVIIISFFFLPQNIQCNSFLESG